MNNPYYNENYDDYMKRQRDQAYGVSRPSQQSMDDLYNTGSPQMPSSDQIIQPGQQSQGGFNMSGLGSYGAVANSVASGLNASNPNNKYQSASDQRVDQAGNSVASAIGPWWGALAQAGEYTSKTAKGNGTNQWNLAIGNADDPFNAFKADYGPGNNTVRTARSILTGGMSRVFTSHKGAQQNRAAIENQKNAFRASQLSANKQQYDAIQQQNQMDEYNKRMNAQNRMNNLYRIPTTYQSMF